MSPGDLVAWLRSVFDGAMRDPERTRSPEPDMASERAVKAPLNEIDTTGARAESTEDGPGTDRPD